MPSVAPNEATFSMSENSRQTQIFLIVPCYNEEDNIPLFIQEAERQLTAYSWKVIFINDGSRDRTWEMIQQASRRDNRILGLCFARNFGHQNALKAGMEECAAHHQADVYITLDADLQHPLSFIPEMVDAWQRGYRVVQAQRLDSGRRISAFKKLSSAAFYGLFSSLSGVPMQAGMSDFRLIDRYTLEFIVSCHDKDFFLRGLIPWSGLKAVILPYTPAERLHGSSKFTLKKMLSLALSGIVGYSTRPLYASIIIGLIALLLAVAYFIYVLTIVCMGYDVSVGWPSVIATILALGGVQLFLLGIVGIYLGKLFMEQKSRPTYVIEEKTATSDR